MPKPDKKIIIIGEQLPELDVSDMARLIVRYAREREAKLLDALQPAEPQAEDAA